MASTIGERSGKRGKWSEMFDSGSEEEGSRPTPLLHTESYDAESSQCDGLRRALSHTMGKLAGASQSPGSSPPATQSPALQPSPGPLALQSPAAEDVLAMASPPPPPATPETDSLVRTGSAGSVGSTQGQKLGSMLLAHIKGHGEKRPRNQAEEAEAAPSPARHVARRSPEPPARWQTVEPQERRGEKRPAGLRSPPSQATVVPYSPLTWAPRSPSPLDGDGAAEDDADQLRRLEKRRAIVAQIKDTAEYKALQRRGGKGKAASAGKGKRKGGLQRITTPDAEDKSISKRSWEGLVMNWRKTVQDQGGRLLDNQHW
eukprot:TRINITY_DN3314_c1_g2_i1.p1 TRINITY_DN3314_c1_g2~~TRINITY_DN3314_c1_g2_i1.p1  ORF type:complete len:334 (-),score=63.03 TRINITY_DN3314_c1_g2_i1:159-1106(-)